MIRFFTPLRRALTLGAAALAFACAASRGAQAEDISQSPSAGPEQAQVSAAPDGPAWLSSLGGVKLVAVDGSTLSLSPNEGGLSLALSSPSGAAERSNFSFLSDRLGTISTDADAGHVIGFFRETDTGLEAMFADGHDESILANTVGGVSLVVRRENGQSSCTTWYPPDHAFTTSERQAALAAYAARLGLNGSAKTSSAAPACAPAVRIAKSAPAAQPAPLSEPLMTATRPTPSAEASVKLADAGGLTPVVVRASQVHAVDSAIAAPAGAAGLLAAPALASPAVAQDAQTSPGAEKVAAVAPSPAASNAPPGSGASDCLSVDSDGANLGFRNHCGYSVEFAYCLKGGASDKQAACGAGERTGTAPANGFAAVLIDTNIKTADAEHDFRWVACSGDPARVAAHLDSSDPPAGRCVVNGAL
ncbi:MAG TPA: hypothetical protein VHC42_04130 [Rhizomicrobium sp.]|nr:hypothetical protein [Rhizomicrobium sp.]